MKKDSGCGSEATNTQPFWRPHQRVETDDSTWLNAANAPLMLKLFGNVLLYKSKNQMKEESKRLLKERILFVSLLWTIYFSPTVSLFIPFLRLLSFLRGIWSQPSWHAITKEITSIFALSSSPLFTPLGLLLLLLCFISIFVFSLQIFYSLHFLSYCSVGGNSVWVQENASTAKTSALTFFSF